MQDSNIHFHRFLPRMPRLLPNKLSVRSLGYLPSKNSLIEKRFDFLAFSFLISGSGKFSTGNMEYLVKGPAMLVEWPGEYYKYGPTDAWEEFYVTYDSNCLPVFKTKPWLFLKKNVIPIQSENFLKAKCNELVELAEDVGAIGATDMIDQFCERLLMDILIQVRNVTSPGESERIYEVKKWLDGHYHENVNLAKLAKEFAFSSTGFSRHWHKVIGGTPGGYLMQVRIQHALALLATTSMPVSKVAKESGFNDYLYFSRRFHIEIGETPSEYRRKNSR